MIPDPATVSEREFQEFIGERSPAMQAHMAICESNHFLRKIILSKFKDVDLTAQLAGHHKLLLRSVSGFTPEVVGRKIITSLSKMETFSILMAELRQDTQSTPIYKNADIAALFTVFIDQFEDLEQVADFHLDFKAALSAVYEEYPDCIVITGMIECFPVPTDIDGSLHHAHAFSDDNTFPDRKEEYVLSILGTLQAFSDTVYSWWVAAGQPAGATRTDMALIDCPVFDQRTVADVDLEVRRLVLPGYSPEIDPGARMYKMAAPDITPDELTDKIDLFITSRADFNKMVRFDGIEKAFSLSFVAGTVPTEDLGETILFSEVDTSTPHFHRCIFTRDRATKQGKPMVLQKMYDAMSPNLLKGEASAMPSWGFYSRYFDTCLAFHERMSGNKFPILDRNRTKCEIVTPRPSAPAKLRTTKIETNEQRITRRVQANDPKGKATYKLMLEDMRRSIKSHIMDEVHETFSDLLPKRQRDEYDSIESVKEQGDVIYAIVAACGSTFSRRILSTFDGGKNGGHYIATIKEMIKTIEDVMRDKKSMNKTLKRRNSYPTLITLILTTLFGEHGVEANMNADFKAFYTGPKVPARDRLIMQLVVCMYIMKPLEPRIQSHNVVFEYNDYPDLKTAFGAFRDDIFYDLDIGWVA